MVYISMRFSKNISMEQLQEYFDDFDCDYLSYGVNKLGWPYVYVDFDDINVEYFKDVTLKNIYEDFDCCDIFTTIYDDNIDVYRR